jgi:hypothetical protein
MQDASPEDELAFYVEALGKRFEKPSNIFTKIVESETG